MSNSEKLLVELDLMFKLKGMEMTETMLLHVLEKLSKYSEAAVLTAINRVGEIEVNRPGILPALLEVCKNEQYYEKRRQNTQRLLEEQKQLRLTAARQPKIEQKRDTSEARPLKTENTDWETSRESWIDQLGGDENAD